LIEQARRFVANDHSGWIPLAYGHAGDGNIHFNVLPPLELAEREARARGAEIIAGLYDIAIGLGGSISAEHGIGRSRRKEFWAGLSPTHRRMVAALKSALDPKGLMNPGCLLPATETFP
jgi:FAD/FMN-containing dehydrogenase